MFSAADFYSYKLLLVNCCKYATGSQESFLKPIIRLMFNKEEHLFVRPEPELPQNE